MTSRRIAEAREAAPKAESLAEYLPTVDPEEARVLGKFISKLAPEETGASMHARVGALREQLPPLLERSEA